MVFGILLAGIAGGAIGSFVGGRREKQKGPTESNLSPEDSERRKVLGSTFRLKIEYFSPDGEIENPEDNNQITSDPTWEKQVDAELNTKHNTKKDFLDEPVRALASTIRNKNDSMKWNNFIHTNPMKVTFDKEEGRNVITVEDRLALLFGSDNYRNKCINYRLHLILEDDNGDKINGDTYIDFAYVNIKENAPDNSPDDIALLWMALNNPDLKSLSLADLVSYKILMSYLMNMALYRQVELVITNIDVSGSEMNDKNVRNALGEIEWAGMKLDTFMPMSKLYADVKTGKAPDASYYVTNDKLIVINALRVEQQNDSWNEMLETPSVLGDIKFKSVLHFGEQFSKRVQK